jgi:hypothetical protein
VPGFKYLVHRNDSTATEFLYDLGRDPREKEPLPEGGDAARYGPAVDMFEALRSQLRREELTAKALRGEKEDPTDVGVELPKEILERLRALGYEVEHDF